MQPQYPATLFNALKHALQRRSLDGTFLPSEVPPLHTTIPKNAVASTPQKLLSTVPTSFWDLREKVDLLTDAVMGTAVDRTITKNLIEYYLPRPTMPPLPPVLRERILLTMTGMEAEAVDLGKNIEMNSFRVARGDPRARTEADLRARRAEAHTRWNALADEMVADVKMFWKMQKRMAAAKL